MYSVSELCIKTFTGWIPDKRAALSEATPHSGGYRQRVPHGRGQHVLVTPGLAATFPQNDQDRSRK